MTRFIETSYCRAPARAAFDFGRREDGSLTIFGLLIFILMMTAGGIALDIMRSEVERTELQYAVDRASLAAAGLSQTRSAEEIVKDYVRAAGLDEDSVTVTTPTSNNQSQRIVSISSEARTNSLFLDLLGVDMLVQPISSEAREVRTKLELSLVVDISGSMGGAKIETLRTAANDFVAELLRNREDLTTISLVPYNDRVNAGSVIASAFDFTTEHPFSNCVVFSDAEYGQLAMGPGDELQRMGDFDFRSGNSNSPGLSDRPNCNRDEYAAILPWSNNVTELQGRIARLQASHWTAMDQGVKWGTLLLDPSSQDEFIELATNTTLDDDVRPDVQFSGRPVSYGTEDTHKVLVVMTDGVNTQQWDLKPARKDGPSGDRDGPTGFYVYREALSYVCRNFDDRNRYYRNGNRVDGLSADDARLCNTWDDRGRPQPFPVATNTPVLGPLIDGSITIGRGYESDGDSVLAIQILDDLVAVNRFGANGVACLLGSVLQQALCRSGFDDDEGGRYVVRYSVYSAETGYFWIDHLNEYWYSPYGGTSAILLEWDEIFASLSMRYIANVILSGAAWDTRVDYFYSWETTHGQSRADANLARICGEARDQGVVIYTIAFQAPLDGQSAMANCANNDSQYFDVQNLDIAAAFDGVLASVTRLRLTQ